jgi:hypothetical protein
VCKGTVVFLLFVAVLCVLAVSGCNRDLFPSSHLSGTPPQELVEIVSIVGPLRPINPGGPAVEITLKNAATVPLNSLSAMLGINRTGPPDLPPYIFSFQVASDNPLLPGKSISARETLIGGGFSDNVFYPVTINGTLQNHSAFSYTKQVLITAPAQ